MFFEFNATAFIVYGSMSTSHGTYTGKQMIPKNHNETDNYYPARLNDGDDQVLSAIASPRRYHAPLFGASDLPSGTSQTFVSAKHRSTATLRRTTMAEGLIRHS